MNICLEKEDSDVMSCGDNRITFVIFLYLHLGGRKASFIPAKLFLSGIMKYVYIEIYTDFILSIHEDFWLVSESHIFTNHYARNSV